MLWHDETFLAPSKTNIGPTSKKSHHFFWSWCASTKISMPMTVGSWYSALGSPQVLGISCQDHLEKGPSLKTGALWQTWKLLMSCLYLFIVSLSLDTYAYVYICNKKKKNIHKLDIDISSFTNGPTSAYVLLYSNWSYMIPPLFSNETTGLLLQANKTKTAPTSTGKTEVRWDEHDCLPSLWSSDPRIDDKLWQTYKNLDGSLVTMSSYMTLLNVLSETAAFNLEYHEIYHSRLLGSRNPSKVRLTLKNTYKMDQG